MQPLSKQWSISHPKLASDKEPGEGVVVLGRVSKDRSAMSAFVCPWEIRLLSGEGGFIFNPSPTVELASSVICFPV